MQIGLAGYFVCTMGEESPGTTRKYILLQSLACRFHPIQVKTMDGFYTPFYKKNKKPYPTVPYTRLNIVGLPVSFHYLD